MTYDNSIPSISNPEIGFELTRVHESEVPEDLRGQLKQEELKEVMKTSVSEMGKMHIHDHHSVRISYERE